VKTVIFKGSRYQNVGVYEAQDATGRIVKALKIRFIPPTPAGYLHTFTNDERLDILAFRFYGNAEKFWLIADANTEMDPEDLARPGNQLLIPPDRK
jgi:nucleoid-associated protein YgaU